MSGISFARYVWQRGPAHQLNIDTWEFAFSPKDDTSEDGSPSLEATRHVRWHKVRDFPDMVQWECYLAGVGAPGQPGPGHPYVGTNSRDYRWTADVTWWMRTFIPENALHQTARRAQLVFDGVDHDAWVWIDGQLVQDHHGMFGGPVVDCTEWLSNEPPPESHQGSHEVLLALNPVGSGQGKEIRPGTKGRLIKPETFCRWINNPDLMTAGIWQPVRLVQTGHYRLERPRVVTKLLDNGSVVVDVEVEVLRTSVQPDLHWVQRHGGIPPNWDNRFFEPQTPRLAEGNPEPAAPASHGPLNVFVTITGPAGEQVATVTTAVDPTPGRVWARVSLVIPEPELWWPNGMGPDGSNPALYTVSIDLEAIDHLEVRTGLRQIEWEQTSGPRTADHWFNWKLRVNGRSAAGPVRGMNWMPSDLLRQDRTRTRHFLTLMRDAGVQLVRVWGGGLLETEDFYDACDELGLLVWQDFPINTMYDCSGIPLDVWEQQVTWTAERLRNRASLAIWCGGNEFDPYAPENAAAIGILERTLHDLDGTRPFVRSCSDPGDVHPYLECDTTWYLPMYREAPALSEWGGHTLPTAASCAEILPKEERERPLTSLLSQEPDAFAHTHPVLRHHWSEFKPDRIPRMLGRARIYDDLSSPLTSFEQGIEANGLGAAELYQTVISDFSAGDTFCQLLMPWVYNRPWPSVGMQVVDHSGRPTLGYFAIRRAYCSDAIVLRPETEALAPGEPLRFSVGLAAQSTQRTLEVLVYNDRLREVERLRLDIAPGPKGFESVVTELPSGAADSAIIVATDVADPAVQHVRIIRVARTLADSAVLTEYRAKPRPTSHFMEGSLRRAIEDHCARVVWIAESDGVSEPLGRRVTLTCENTSDVPAVFVQIESRDSRWMVLPSDSGFWIPPHRKRTLKVHVRPTAEVSTIATDRPNPGAGPTAAITVSGWNA
ncbi:MAG: hypothetical protein L0K34_00015 [Ancrocorticia sp.]|nr:hypothetical protein [Ancrocorticia sp.]